jgi:hypothetical protein
MWYVEVAWLCRGGLVVLCYVMCYVMLTLTLRLRFRVCRGGLVVLCCVMCYVFIFLLSLSSLCLILSLLIFVIAPLSLSLNHLCLFDWRELRNN